MDNKVIAIILFYMLLFWACGFAFGHNVGTEQQYEINNKLKEEYDELKRNYDTLERQYERDLSVCYIQLGGDVDDE